MRKFKIGDTWVQFPYIPYGPQEKFMQEMLKCLQNGQNALLESPTGTGKTLCLLGASLAWLDSQRKLQEMPELGWFESHQPSAEMTFDESGYDSMFPQKHYKIYFCSRTHSQIKQAINQYQECSYGHLRSAVLGSRRHLCINPVAKNAENNMETKCRALRRETKCKALGPDIEDLPNKCNSCFGDHKCQFYSNFERMKADHQDHIFREGGALDQMELIKKCKEHNVCPFYMSRHLSKSADIIFLPYSYIFNPHILRGLQLNLRDAVLIIDEGHNLERVCEENASFSVMVSDFLNAERELRISLEFAGHEDFPTDIHKNDILEIEMITRKLADYFKTKIEEGNSSYTGKFCLELFAEAGLNYDNQPRIIYNLRQIIQGCGEKDVKTDGMKKLCDVISCVFYLGQVETDNTCSTLEESFVLFKPKLKPEERSKEIEPKIFFWCFDAGLIMRSLRDKGVRSFIVTSGTLSPLEPLKKSLSIDFQVTLKNEHVIDKMQVLALSVPKGSTMNGSSEDFNLKYTKREERGDFIYEALGNLVYRVASVSPKGLLMFFPSSSVKEKCLERWTKVCVEDEHKNLLSLYDAIHSRKSIFVEPKLAGDLPGLQQKFNEKINEAESHGACLIGVMSGKVSEGIDFKDDLGRVVIMVGVPFPPIEDPWVKMKMKHLSKQDKSPEDWYLSVAIRPVNQALGRIIRHQGDYGVILMVDLRYSHDSQVIKALPKWLKKDTHMNRFTLSSNELKTVKFNELQDQLRGFFSKIPMTMSKIKKQTETEQAEILRKHEGQSTKEVFPDTDYHELLKMRDDERAKAPTLRTEIDTLIKKLKEKSDQLRLLQILLWERQQVEKKEQKTKRVVDAKMQSEVKEVKASECDSDCESLGDSEWEAVEAFKSK